MPFTARLHSHRPLIAVAASLSLATGVSAAAAERGACIDESDLDRRAGGAAQRQPDRDDAHAAAARRQRDPAEPALERDRPRIERLHQACQFRRHQSGRLSRQRVGPLRRGDPRRSGGRDRGRPRPVREGAPVGAARPSTAERPGELRPIGSRLRSVRAGSRQALQRQLHARRILDPAARRQVLVDLERARLHREPEATGHRQAQERPELAARLPWAGRRGLEGTRCDGARARQDRARRAGRPWLSRHSVRRDVSARVRAIAVLPRLQLPPAARLGRRPAGLPDERRCFEALPLPESSPVQSSAASRSTRTRAGIRRTSSATSRARQACARRSPRSATSRTRSRRSSAHTARTETSRSTRPSTATRRARRS